MARGLWRAQLVATLRTLTGEPTADDPVRWKAWYAKRKDSIDQGSFARPAKPLPAKPLPAVTRFYSIPSASRDLAFLLDTSWSLDVPALHAEERKRHWRDWRGGSKEWRKQFPSHKVVLAQKFDRAVASLPADASFRILAVGHTKNDVDAMAELGPLRGAKPRDRAAAQRFVASMRAALVNPDPHVALLRALRIDGLDTVFLLHTGQLLGSRFYAPDVMLADFERRNRFRRLVVHAIRICDTGAESGKWMRALAERSGGSYVWATTP